MNESLPTLGNIMRALRTRNGWTRKQMSARTGIPLSTLAKVEKDLLTLSYDKLIQIAQRLSLDNFSLEESLRMSPSHRQYPASP